MYTYFVPPNISLSKQFAPLEAKALINGEKVKSRVEKYKLWFHFCSGRLDYHFYTKCWPSISWFDHAMHHQCLPSSPLSPLHNMSGTHNHPLDHALRYKCDHCGHEWWSTSICLDIYHLSELTCSLCNAITFSMFNFNFFRQ